ncbi:MAG: SH3 domain-containing protein, partial [Saprospiraceae bacterium]
GPATTFPIVKKLSKGDEVQVFEAKDKWLRVGTGEWVFQDFVQL